LDAEAMMLEQCITATALDLSKILKKKATYSRLQSPFLHVQRKFLTVLIELLGDRMRFIAGSLTLPGVTRDYQRFSEAAQENGLSRLYAGIHFRYAVKEGRRQGRRSGQAVAAALGPVYR
jgi:hypothetical protein